jgi:hypothetical protein
MNQKRFSALLAKFALDNPHRPLAEVTAVEFSTWYYELKRIVRGAK